MLWRRLLLAASALVCTTVHADCLKDHRSSKTSGLIVTDFTIVGTRGLGSEALSAMTSQLVGSCFNDSSEELEERIRAWFQDRGYFAAQVTTLKIKPNDALGVPKPVTLEAEVSEGMRYRVRKIEITGNHAFSKKTILGRFSLRRGDVFERNKIAGAIESIRNLYTPSGYLSMYIVPDTGLLGDGTVALILNINEGPQYRMGKLEVITRKEDAEKLRASWQLSEGSVFDATYIEKYLAENRASFPKGFNAESIQVISNCPDALVTVRVVVDQFDPRAQSSTTSVPCDSPVSSLQ